MAARGDPGRLYASRGAFEILPEGFVEASAAHLPGFSVGALKTPSEIPRELHNSAGFFGHLERGTQVFGSLLKNLRVFPVGVT